MTQRIMMQLGSLQFGIDTAAYDKFSRSTAYEWAAQKRFGQYAALQFLGPGEDMVTLDGAFYPEFMGAWDQVSDWRTAAANGQPLSMISGRGEILGQWVIEKIDDKQSIFGQAGAARKTEFSLSLRFYAESQLTQDEIDASSAINSAAPTTGIITQESAASSLASGAATAMGGLASSLTGAVAQIQSVASLATMSLAPALATINQGLNLAQVLKNSAINATGLIKSIQTINSKSTASAGIGGLLSKAAQVSCAAGAASGSLSSITAAFNNAGQNPLVVSALQSASSMVNQLTLSATQTNQQAQNIIDTFTS